MTLRECYRFLRTSPNGCLKSAVKAWRLWRGKRVRPSPRYWT